MAALRQDIAADLRREIEAGVYQPGTVLPREVDLIERYGVGRQTIRQAIAQLTAEGLVQPVRRRGTVVEARPVAVPVSRYGRVLRPGGQRGPWETACADAGVEARVDVVGVDHLPAPDDVADLLGIEAGDVVVRRRRHMYADDDLAQVQEAWMPAAIAAGLLSGTGKVVGGVLGALAASGRHPATFSESVAARLPSSLEADELGIATTTPVFVIERITRDAAGIALELLRLVADARRIRLIYDDLPLVAGS